MQIVRALCQRRISEQAPRATAWAESVHVRRQVLIPECTAAADTTHPLGTQRRGTICLLSHAIPLILACLGAPPLSWSSASSQEQAASASPRSNALLYSEGATLRLDSISVDGEQINTAEQGTFVYKKRVRVDETKQDGQEDTGLVIRREYTETAVDMEYRSEPHSYSICGTSPLDHRPIRITRDELAFSRERQPLIQLGSWLRRDCGLTSLRNALRENVDADEIGVDQLIRDLAPFRWHDVELHAEVAGWRLEDTMAWIITLMMEEPVTSPPELDGRILIDPTSTLVIKQRVCGGSVVDELVASFDFEYDLDVRRDSDWVRRQGGAFDDPPGSVGDIDLDTVAVRIHWKGHGKVAWDPEDASLVSCLLDWEATMSISCFGTYYAQMPMPQSRVEALLSGNGELRIKRE